MTQPSSSNHLRAGVGRADITPPLGTPLTGYPDPHCKRLAESVRDPLNATAIVVQQGEQTAAIISLDMCVIDDIYVQRIREGVCASTQIPLANIIVSATHSHSTPRTHSTWGWGEPNETYATQIMIPGAIEAAKAAVAKLLPARLGIGTRQSEAGINRRELNEQHQAKLGQLPWGLTDSQMTVLRFDGEHGTIANIVHYGAHPTVLRGDSKLISRDWPGIMVDRLEQLTGATTLYINGAQGDVAPHTSTQLAVGDGEVALWEAGARAALDAMGVWRRIKEQREVSLGILTQSYELPYRPLTPRDEAIKLRDAAEGDKDLPGTGMCNYRHNNAVVEAHDQPMQTGKAFLQTLIALGPAVFVPVPGEPFTEISLRLRHASPFEHTLVAAATNGSNGYFCSQEQLCRGGYEPWVGRAFGAYLLTDQIDDVLVSENLSMLKTLHQQMLPPWPSE